VHDHLMRARLAVQPTWALVALNAATLFALMVGIASHRQRPPAAAETGLAPTRPGRTPQ
jgi:hypothetical protein